MEIDISASEYKKIVSLINTYLPDTDVWAFGSRVKFTSKPESDLDLVAFTDPDQHLKLQALKDAFSESDLPFKVDLLEWDNIPVSFKLNIEKSRVDVTNKAKQNAGNQNWKGYKLGEIVSDIAMGPFGSNLKVDNFISSGVPVIRGGNLNEGGFNDAKFVYVSDAKAESLKRCLARPNDLVFTHRGTLGQVGIIPDGKYPKYLVSQSQMRLTVNRDKLVPKFLYYFFKSPLGQSELLKNVSQVGVPAIANPTKSLKEVRISVPDISTQTLISNILSSLDDKIELNNQMNQTLEEMAQTIFKEWFINFNFSGFDGEFVDGLPKGWKEEPIDKDIEYLNGLALQKFPATSAKEYLPVIKIKELKQGVTDSSDKANTKVPDQYIINNGDILFSWSGSLEVVVWSGSKGALNQHLFKVSSAKYPKWFYYYWTKHFLPKYQAIAADKATTMGHIQRKHLTESIINVPDVEIMEKANDIFLPILERYICNSLQINALKQLRDILLPKLMSGKITIKT